MEEWDRKKRAAKEKEGEEEEEIGREGRLSDGQ